MDSYWDLYVAYVHHCVEYNKKHDIDPHHYEMEWNHFLPKCLFGDLPFGQWLTLRQHAIASALQTIAFEYRCMFGTHIAYLPERLWELAKPYYVKGALQGAKVTMELKLGIFDPKNKERVEEVNLRNWTTEQRREYAILGQQRRDPEERVRISRHAAQYYWANVSEESKKERSSKLSQTGRAQWELLDKEQRKKRLAPARKSLMKSVKIIRTDGSEEVYSSLTEAAEELGTNRKKIAYMAKKNLVDEKLGVSKVVILEKIR
jgi:hypothetical protein